MVLADRADSGGADGTIVFEGEVYDDPDGNHEPDAAAFTGGGKGK